MAKKINYSVTIGYKAVIQIDIKADNEEDAKKQALEYFNQYRFFGNKSTINDDNYKVEGILNMDATWNMVQS
jgi:hypothetical protein